MRDRIEKHTEDERRGTLAIIHIGTSLRDAWLAEEQPGWTPEQSIQKAAEVLAFVMHWRHHVATTSGLNLKKHCLTRETILDTIISCASCILRFPLFRDHHPEFKPYGPNLSSRFSEYGFNFSRKESASLSCRGHQLSYKHYLAQMSMQASAPEGLHVPDTRRRLYSDGIGRIHRDPPPAGWFPSDAQIAKLVEQGLDNAITMMRCVCRLDIQPGTDLFVKSWKVG